MSSAMDTGYKPFLTFSACLNIVLDLVFIVVFKLGVAGAALATVVAQGVSAVLCGGYIFLKVNALTPETGQWRLNSSDSKHQLSMGLPMAFQFAITASGGMVMQSAINLFGSNAVAAYTAAGKLEALVEQGMVAMLLPTFSHLISAAGIQVGSPALPGFGDGSSEMERVLRLKSF